MRTAFAPSQKTRPSLYLSNRIATEHDPIDLEIWCTGGQFEHRTTAADLDVIGMSSYAQYRLQI